MRMFIKRMERKNSQTVSKSMAVAWFVMLFALTGSIGSRAIPVPDSKKVIADSTAAKPFEVLPDSSNFVTVSIIISSPGKGTFYAMGHTGLRLQCPSKGLDYNYSYVTELDQGPLFNLTLMAGKMRAGFEAVAFDEYLDLYRKEGRGVKEFPLNLTLSEERALWELMDNQMMEGINQPFDFINYNCTSRVLRSVETILQSEDIVYPKTGVLAMCNRDGVTEIMGKHPWIEFLTLTMMSALPPDEPCPLELFICPTLWAELLPQAKIVGLDGSERPALDGEVKELLPVKWQPSPTWWTPIRTFGLMLVLVLLVTLAEWLLHWKRVPKILDVSLFVLYTLFSAYLLYAVYARIFVVSWNYMLLAFNLLPLLLWLLFRRKRWFGKIYAFYALALVAFMIFFSFYMGRMEWAHELLLASLLTRCVSRYFKYK